MEATRSAKAEPRSAASTPRKERSAGAGWSSTSESDLVQRHRYGDPQAFEEIYEEFAGLVYNLALRMSGRPGNAEDLSQEVFLRIHRYLGRFNGRSSLKTWVYRVTLNHCRSRLGRKKIPIQSLAEDTEDGRGVKLRETRRNPEQRAMASDVSRQISAALPQIKAVYREALILRDLEELTYQEIAKVLGVRMGTVRSRIARGRDQLRRVLGRAP